MYRVRVALAEGIKWNGRGLVSGAAAAGWVYAVRQNEQELDLFLVIFCW